MKTRLMLALVDSGRSFALRMFVWLLLLFAVSADHAAAGESWLSSDAGSRFSTVPHDPTMQEAVRASLLNLIVVQHEGWQETVPTFARLMINELTGRTSVHGQDPSYTILSMIYENHCWYGARIFPLEHPDLLDILQVRDKWVSARDVTENPNLPKLLDLLRSASSRRDDLEQLTRLLNAVEQVYRLGREDRVLMSFEGITPDQILALLDNPEKLKAEHARRIELVKATDKEKPLLKAGNSLLRRVRLLNEMPGEFLIVPDSEAAENTWIIPAAFTTDGSSPIATAGRSFDLSMRQAFLSQQPDLVRQAGEKFLPVIERSRFYPSETFRKTQNWYVRNNPWRIAAWIYLLAAITFGLQFFFRRRPLYWSAVAISLVGFLFHTAAVAIRLYLKGGHMPVSNMFEAITFCSWGVLFIAIIMEGWHRKGLVGLGATTIAFLLLTGAGLMPLHDTRLHPLRAVLDSYWLNIHVTMMLLSYAAFAISAFFSLVYIVKSFLGREALFGEEPVMSLAQTEEFAYRLVQIGWPILTFGVTLGAVWADNAWGRYWGWDPKETWAFITWCTYTVYLHTRMVMGWRGRWSAIACLVGFLMVLITMLGVSYLPWFAGGLHSYASPT